MRQFLLVASITVVGFAAGSAAGVYYERHSPLPPPPGRLGGELVGHRLPPFGSGGRPINRAKLIEQVKALGPQIEDYKQKVDQIDAEFERGLDVVLTPDQRTLHAERLKHQHERGHHDDKSVLTDDQISRIMQWGSDQILRTIIIDLRLHELNRELKLEQAQQDQVRVLLHHRRDEMIALVDSVPPPSVQLMTLAPMIQRLAPANAVAATAPSQP